MAEAVINPQEFQVTSEDGSLSVSAHSVPGYTNTMSVEERWPSAKTFDEIDTEFFWMAHDSDKDWALFVSPRFSGDDVMRAVRFRGILEGLGYKLEVQKGESGDQNVRQKIYHYPSIGRVNDFIEEVFGGKEEEVEFVPYYGSEYDPMDFVQRFVEEGKILVATDQPHEVHDLSDHVLGWLGLNPELIKLMRERVGKYVTRLQAELGNPPLPLTEEALADSRTLDFIYPSRTVIKRAMNKLDVLSGLFAQAALSEKSDDQAWTEMEKAIDDFFKTKESSAFGYEPLLPEGLFGKPPFSSRHVAESWLRYEKADKTGHRLAAAA